MYKVASSRLSLDTRREAIASAVGGVVDVAVVGGGVVGCGIAVDAASRGLSVALLERDDFGSGASSRSSKLVHGGLRYLEQREFRLVREALHERAVLLENAPHLVSPVRFLYPVRRRGLDAAYVRGGLWLYDGLAGRGTPLPAARWLGRQHLRSIAPGLKPSLAGAFEFWDAMVDDARLTLTLARTAASLGALVASRVEVHGLRRASGRVSGVRAIDRLTDEELSIRARHVICAVGAEAELFQERVGARKLTRAAPSKGAHILVPRDRISSGAAVVTRTPDSVLFVLPWNGHWLLGTTDTPWNQPGTQPRATSDDARYLLAQANRVLAEPLELTDVRAGYAGIRPLVDGGDARTTRLSREHAVVRSDDGLVVVLGGKLTTYRVMARDAVSAAVPGAAPSATRELPLVGAGEPDGASGKLRDGRLLGRYGTLLPEVVAPAQRDLSLLDPIAGAPGYLRAEALYAVTHEGALDLEDVLARRTRIAIETPDHGLAAAEAIAALIAPVLGWDAPRTEHEFAVSRSRVAGDLQLDMANSTARRSISSASSSRVATR